MFDIWGFLLQTLTATGVGVLLIIIKALFRDKLPPKWHFAVWSILGITLLLPAGLMGRYSLFNWQSIIEFIKVIVGDYSFTRVLFPLPYISTMPKTVTEWLFVIYVAGIFICLIKYLISYIKLRVLLRKGNSPANEVTAHIREIAESQKLNVCKLIELPDLPSAFLCGIIKPVLVLPAGKEIDDKIIMHELLHFKYRDTFWSVVICFFKCLHWCNPFISHCANEAINDMEARCDQRVLELLEGEERRDYGRILLSMANEKFAKTPGSTTINNGGKNIRNRIEAIAHFKKYPAGMRLVSICIIIVLGFSLVTGVQAKDIPEPYEQTKFAVASARSISCTTPAGAFDTYAKAVIKESPIYRLMCAPEDMQSEFINCDKDIWDSGLSGYAESSNYYIYNIEVLDDEAYEGVLVLRLVNEPDGMEWEEGKYFVAHQKIRVFKEKGRWVTIPLSDFSYVATESRLSNYGCIDLPAVTYTNTIDDYKVDMNFQTVYLINNETKSTNNSAFSSLYGETWRFNSVPIPNAEFTEAYDNHETVLTHLGTQEEREQISQLGISSKAIYTGEEIPEELYEATGGTASGSSSDGTSWGTRDTYEDWGPTLLLDSSGGGGTFSQFFNNNFPEFFVADLYVNNEFYARMELRLQEEVE